MAIEDIPAHALQEVLHGISANEVQTAEQDAAAFPRLDGFNQGAIYVGRFCGDSPWERHPDADELLHILEGEVEITYLSHTGKHHRRWLKAGTVIVVPRNVWHRQRAPVSVTMLAVTPDNSETSVCEDPRQT